MLSDIILAAINKGMFIGLKHTHSTFMILYVVHHFVKVILLLMGNYHLLEKYRKYTRIPLEMVIPTIALGAGIAVFIIGDYDFIDFYMLLKWIGLVIAIPLGIIAFKRNNKPFAILSLFILIACIVLAYTKPKRHTQDSVATPTGTIEITEEAKTKMLEKGMVIYTNNCKLCHGSDGKLALNNASNLATSDLPASIVQDQITNGKNLMPAFKDKITNQEDMDALVMYVISLRK